MINYGLNSLNSNSAFDQHFRDSTLAMLEKLGNRISDLETQMRNSNEKSISVKNYQKGTTDTERLDFIKSTKYELVYHPIPGVWRIDYFPPSVCPRAAIDAAMGGKDGD